MTPKEKAEELYSKMYGETLVRTIIEEIKEDKQLAKQCALIAVDEMYDIAAENNNVQQVNYLVDVKQEIEKL
jgi:hypothetical protein